MRTRRIPAQPVKDCQLRYERAAEIDVAKAKADVCTRLPPAACRQRGRRGARQSARPREVLALAGRLIAGRGELFVMESISDY
jgi:hypothetical protein